MIALAFGSWLGLLWLSLALRPQEAMFQVVPQRYVDAGAFQRSGEVLGWANQPLRDVLASEWLRFSGGSQSIWPMGSTTQADNEAGVKGSSGEFIIHASGRPQLS